MHHMKAMIRAFSLMCYLLRLEPGNMVNYFLKQISLQLRVSIIDLLCKIDDFRIFIKAPRLLIRLLLVSVFAALYEYTFYFSQLKVYAPKSRFKVTAICEIQGGQPCAT